MKDEKADETIQRLKRELLAVRAEGRETIKRQANELREVKEKIAELHKLLDEKSKDAGW